MNVFVCKYQLRADSAWFEGVRIQNNKTGVDIIINASGEIVYEPYKIINAEDKGCLNVDI